jgi:hypothetical protein
MKSDKNSSKRVHISASNRGYLRMTKNVTSKDKKGVPRGCMWSSKDRKEEKNCLKKPLDVDPGPEGEVSGQCRISNALN